MDSPVVFRSVVRVCTTKEACMNNAAGNNPKCDPGENFVSLLVLGPIYTWRTLTAVKLNNN